MLQLLGLAISSAACSAASCRASVSSFRTCAITHAHQFSAFPSTLSCCRLLMAVTMTLHNLPEGFAVAFAAFTDFGPVMALAIAIHNIPEVRFAG